MSVRVVVMAGGVGGAKLAHGMSLLPAVELQVIVNTADDLEMHGLQVCPDLDTVMYTLAGLANAETGWGMRDETWSAQAMLERYGAETWFSLGDRDLATSIRRTSRLRAGRTLTEVTDELRTALGVPARILPMSDAPVRTRLRTDAGWLEFQDYFVRRGHRDDVHELRYEGAATASPTREALDALRGADLVAIAPSNPFLSIGPMLALPGMSNALVEIAAPIVAVSPIVAGAALRGPADRLLVTLGGEASALGVARHYVERHPGLLDSLVIDELDRAQAPAIEALGLRVRAAATVMPDDAARRRLAQTVLEQAADIAPRRPPAVRLP